MLKVLLANHHLAARSGSELYVTELAEALATRGARVAVFSLFPGALAAEFTARTGIPVFGPEHVDDVIRLAPDIVHSHHVTAYHLLGELLPGVPRVHGILGVVPDLEQLPINLAEACRVFAVSERVRDMLLAGFPDASVEIVRNWFDDRELVPVRQGTPAADARHNLLVVSNHASPERDAALDQLAREGLVTWERAGIGAVPQAITGTRLAGFDLVLTIGRTVLLAGAIGVPCIVADNHLSDGLLTAEGVDELAALNFTGRARRHSLTADHLRAEIARSKLIDRHTLARRIRADYSLSSRSLHFMKVYDEVVAASPRSGGTLAPRRGEGMVYREMALEISRLQSEAPALQAEIAQLRAELAHLRDRTAAMLASTSWKITAPMRRLRRIAGRPRP